MDTNIDITTMLFLRYKQPIVLLDTLISDYIPHMNINTARKKAKNYNSPSLLSRQEELNTLSIYQILFYIYFVSDFIH